MKLSQMYPSKFLQAEDLPKNQNTIVTIEKVYPVEARDRGGSDEPEVRYNIRFREFRKPMTLWKNTGHMIGEVLGTDETEEWVGQQIAIYPSTYLSFGEMKPCINVDKWRPEVTQRKQPGNSLVIAGDRRPIPDAAMKRFLLHAKSGGGSWDAFLKWSKANAMEAFDLAYGRELTEIPAGILPAMAQFLKTLHIPSSGDEVNTATGEVVSNPQRPSVAAASSPIPPSELPVDDEDIPF
ncbi:MAG: hypothetical protein IPK69_11740 [Phycisphaerales bacterium]|nr:MAG: hypothetical protein IPK69_11740 [Phycisphaerales bacterium]